MSVIYCQPVVHNEEEAVRAARLINYLNSHLKYECDMDITSGLSEEWKNIMSLSLL